MIRVPTVQAQKPVPVAEAPGQPEERRTRYTYTLNGQLASLQDGAGQTTTYGYDGHDRPVTTTYPGGSREQQHYDGAGRLSGHTTRAGQRIHYGYDALSRLTSQQEPGRGTTTYGYDASGLPTAVSLDGQSIRYQYDTVGRLNWIKDAGGRIVSYGHDANGNRSHLTWPDGWKVTYQYDALDRLTHIRQGGQQLARYTYDALSRRQSLTYPNTTSGHYNWQADDLTGLEHRLGDETITLGYQYNATGQTTRLEVQPETYLWQPYHPGRTDYQRNSLNQYRQAGSQTLTYDANGNLTDAGSHSYRYDAANRLVEVDGPNGQISYHYDPEGKRQSETLNAGGQRLHYLYDGARVIGEYDQEGRLQRRYVYGAHLDEPLVMVSGGLRYYYHADAQGSILALSDGSGQVVERYAYGPFGEGSRPSQLGNPYRYTARRLDGQTGLYHYRARAYHPGLGRFLQPDPIGYGDGMNLYAYVGNDPFNLVDPWGLAGRSHWGWNLFHGTLDGIGLVPGFGELADLVNGTVYFARGDKANGTLSYLSAIPFIGYGATAAKIGDRAVGGIVSNSGRKFWTNSTMFNGNKVFQRNDLIDPSLVDSRSGLTNVELMRSGRAPIGPDGKPINLHHMTQRHDGAIAEVSQKFHQQNSSVIHINPSSISSGINRAEFNKWRSEYWKSRANDF